jgi:hypothetical protein
MPQKKRLGVQRKHDGNKKRKLVSPLIISTPQDLVILHVHPPINTSTPLIHHECLDSVLSLSTLQQLVRRKNISPAGIDYNSYYVNDDNRLWYRMGTVIF